MFYKNAKSIKAIITIIIAILVIFGSFGCSSTSVEQSKGDSPTIKVMLDWYPNAVHTFLYVADKKGYFKEKNIQVEFVMPAETNDPLRLVAAKKIDLALSYQPEIISARDKGIPIIAIASIVNHPLNVLLVPDNGVINSPSELSGKNIGYPSIPMNEALVKTMVKHDGGDISKLHFVDIGWDLMPAISTSKVDAISGGFLNHEEVLLNKKGFKVKEFYPTDYGVPNYAELMLVTSNEQWEDKADLIKKFWSAAIKGYNDVVSNPEASLQILLDQQKEEFPLDSEVEKISLNRLLPLMETEHHEFGWQDEEQWTQVQKWLKQYQLVEKETPVNNLFINIVD